MARPILVIKNIDAASKRYGKVKKEGGKKAVRFEFGIPFALQEVFASKPRAKSAILEVLHDGDRLNGQKLVRLLDRLPDLTVKEIVMAVDRARF